MTHRALRLVVADAGDEAFLEVEAPTCSLDCERGCRSHATGLASLNIWLLALAKFGERVQLRLGSGWNKACAAFYFSDCKDRSDNMQLLARASQRGFSTLYISSFGLKL